MSEAMLKNIWKDYGTISHCVSLDKHCALGKTPTSIKHLNHYSEKQNCAGVRSDENENAT